MSVNRNRAGLIVGAFSGLWHVLWSALVAAGAAQRILDWIYGLHFLNNPFRVGAFNVLTAGELVLFTFVSGYITGWVLAFLWNAMHKSRERPGPLTSA